MKKAAPENGLAEGPAVKRSKADPDIEGDGVNETVEGIEKLQEQLHSLDERCAKEQMQIQKQFDERKKPLFEARQKLIEKIPTFWADALSHHPALSVISEHDRPMLECLKRIDLEDNLDDNGSYRISFIFSEEAKKYFEPLTLVKHMKFEENQEVVEECSEILWKDGMNPITKLRNKQDSDDEDLPEWSLFEWFSKTISGDKPDLGEVVRREIWHQPLSYYMGEQPYDVDDDEDEEDADDDEAVDDEEEEMPEDDEEKDD